MKILNGHPCSPPAITQQAYLDRLGKHLTFYLPAPQILEILSDYRERFQAGQESGKSEADLIKALGSPKEAALSLLEENPPSGLLQHILLWGTLLALCFMFLWSFVVYSFSRLSSYLCGCLFVLMTAVVLFLLLRGSLRATLERHFPPEQRASSPLLLGLPLALAAAFEAVLQYLLYNPAIIPASVSPGLAVQLLCFGMAGLMMLLSVWWTIRSITCSIWYFSGAVHALGLSVAGLTSLLPFISMEAASNHASLHFDVLLAFLPELTGLAAALLLMRTQLPACFQQRSGGRQDYLDQLGKCLLRWFSASQVREILTDYQEQFELGLEHGKTESTLVNELGRPETVARDLLSAESPPVRRCARQRAILWLIPLLPAIYCLLSIFYIYLVGYGNWPFVLEAAPPIVLPLGAVSMFALLHGKGRAEVESQFPPEQGKPPALVFLLPMVLVAAAASGLLYLLVNSVELSTRFVSIPIGNLTAIYLEGTFLLLAVLLAWTLSLSFTRSIQYFPATVHATGAMVSIPYMASFLKHIDPTVIDSYTSLKLAGIVLPTLSSYLTCLLMAVGFAVAIKLFGASVKEV